ncbi:oxygen-independent coproporphyrinogen III oxidase [Acuticoccus sediminis]|uniref:oxygen-independent coproporphyrinogen III oxidase n=1 Tax=Acuticoccus sediminis TaxID=2184697 RepID=UPI00299E3F9A|nr:oxygen-independent coproporphyrinogen III oxidase [Acuticoccus sediminis]
MAADLANYMTMAVPRYTSYPTAPHFHTGIDADTYASWLAQLDADAPVSLYLHVPFCRQICWYCGCNMKLVGDREEPLRDYVDVLDREIALVAGALPARLKVSHIHWGGGTPTVLSGDDLAKVMATLHRHFDVRGDAEVAIECDPRTFDAAKANALGALGFNRASFGVQEFDPRVQAAINRIQPPAMVAAAVEALTAAGIERINFDLIYGLPHQTTEMLLDTVAQCLGLGPSRIALFGYAHVPWAAKRQRMIAAEALPGASERFQQAERAADALVAGGMVAVGMDHFAFPDDPLAKAVRTRRLRRNFQGYTTDEATTLIGMGSTSIGRTPFGYVQNASETGAWARAITEGRLAVAKGVCLSEDDVLRGRAIEELMCFGTLDMDDLARRFEAQQDWADDALAFLRPLEADGLVTIDHGRVTVTPAGRPFVRIIASSFDRYITRGPCRHSAAV